ncbi:hypothetical protein [Caldinitratiruptor microaerophilus]|uniref:Na+-driven multidrug efflux pump n=1 Tax=Caldinitratiruptor microaerophilus TaxID=671077 RepID=A0AA35G6H2_9FIRM|nr:hypothetical protein [Caldinitratiruptor microaerophilus]BDG61306.1 hypothetical protein caldi_23960 [Caldinitratiruptor microaerophilus]
MSARQLFLLFLPLAFSNGLMALGETVVGASLSRWPDPVIALAAFGSAFNVALVIEGPVIMLLHASNALVRDRATYRLVRGFTIALGASLALLHALVAFTPLYDVIFRSVLHLPAPVASEARAAFIAMLPFTPAVGWRRFLQGIMIRQGRTTPVGIGTVVRFGTLLTVVAAGSVAVRSAVVPSAAVGAFALSMSVVAEAAYTHRVARRAVRAVPAEAAGTPAGSASLTWGQLLRFYWPLASTSVVVYLARPVVTAALARGVAVQASLAGWPVLTNTLFLFVDSLSMLQQLVIPYAEGPTRAVVRRVAVRLALAAGAAIALLGLSPLGELYLSRVIGLRGEVLQLVGTALGLAVPYPAGLVLQSWFQGILVRQKWTAAITAGAVINLLVLSAVSYTGVAVTRLPGLYLLTAGMILGLLAEGAWLALVARAAEGQTRAPVTRGLPG